MQRRDALWAALSLCCAFGSPCSGEDAATVPPEPPEYLELTNLNTRPVSVFIRPRQVKLQGGQIVSNTRWFGPWELKAENFPGESIRLPGYEPFDITIRDGNLDLVMSNVPLCQRMATCRNGGSREFTLKAGQYRWATVEDGKPVYKKLTGDIGLTAKVDARRVKLEIPQQDIGSLPEPDPYPPDTPKPKEDPKPKSPPRPRGN